MQVPIPKSAGGPVILALQTHYVDAALCRRFRRLTRQLPAGFEARLLVHLAPGAPVPPQLRALPHHLVRTDELHCPRYPGKPADAVAKLWESGSVDLIALAFIRAHPSYAHYWFVEYDVHFTGNWLRYFKATQSLDADFLAPAIRSRMDDPGWAWWDGFRPTEALLPAMQICAFMPIFRVSRAAVAAVDMALRAGWVGHSEAVWPSAIQAAGLTLAEPGGDGPFTVPALRGRFHASTTCATTLAPGTMMFKPVLLRPGSRPDMLWHPVKPFWVGEQIRSGLHDLRVELGALRRRIALLSGPSPRPKMP